MTTNIDEMTPDQLRDALAVAAGWCNPTGYLWHASESNAKLPVELGSPRTSHPIPTLDSPEALGVVAEMMLEGWWYEVHNHKDAFTVWAWRDERKRTIGDDPEQYGDGPTETIARARLVLKVLAATKEKA